MTICPFFSRSSTLILPIACLLPDPQPSPLGTRLQLSHADPDCFCSPLSGLVLFFFFPSPPLRFSLDRKRPEVFLVGNSWTGMLLREQAVREESRFSGSCPTPCSAIPSLAWVAQSESCQDSQPVPGNSRLFWFCRILEFWWPAAPELCFIFQFLFYGIAQCFQ